MVTEGTAMMMFVSGLCSLFNFKDLSHAFGCMTKQAMLEAGFEMTQGRHHEFCPSTCRNIYTCA